MTIISRGIRVCLFKGLEYREVHCIGLKMERLFSAEKDEFNH